MENLPEEVLVDIFSFCGEAELLNLTLTCKYFNKLISETSRLCSRLTIYFQETKRRYRAEKESGNNFGAPVLPLPPPEFINFSNRKYRKIVANYFDPDQHSMVLDAIGSDIQDVNIYGERSVNHSLDTWKLKDFFRLLEKCKNVNNLSLVDVQFTNEDNYGINVPQLNHLVDIELMNVDWRIFGTFGTSKCPKQAFELQDWSPISNEKNFFLNVKFRLKRFSFKDSIMLDTSSFFDFLDLHAETLECLSTDLVVDRQLSKFISSCKVLEELTINGVEIDENLQPVPTVRQLTLEFGLSYLLNFFDKLLFAKFPGLKVLKFRNFNTFQNKLNEELTGSQIEELTIEDSLIGGFYKIPNLKKLHFKNKSRIDSYEIFDVNPQIEEVTVDDCKFSEADEMEVRSRLTNLKYFKNFNVKKDMKRSWKKMRY